MKNFKRWVADEKGQGTVEYLLVIGVIVVAVIAIGYKFGDQIQTVIDSVMTAVKGSFGGK
jgi:Flp pilus assembly pilin Flp